MKGLRSYLLMIVFLVCFHSCQKDDPAPKAEAEFTSTVLDEGMVAFFNTSKNATSYAWKFGDDKVSTEIAPNHKYATDGTYTVELTSKGPGGDATKTQTVVVANINPFVGTWKMVSTAREGCVTPSNNKPVVNCGGTGPNDIVCATMTITTRALVSDWGAAWGYTRTGNVLNANQNNGIVYTLGPAYTIRSTEQTNFNACINVVYYTRL